MIRKAELHDLPKILSIYASARRFMAENGNPTQWGENFPPEGLLRADIQKRQLYVCTKGDSICGVFAFIIGEDSTYRQIENGAWRSEMPYGTIHRIAGDGTEKGIFTKCINYCREQISYLRIDTHEKNEVMKYLIQKNGFKKCGIIYVRDGSPRIAFDFFKG